MSIKPDEQWNGKPPETAGQFLAKWSSQDSTARSEEMRTDLERIVNMGMPPLVAWLRDVMEAIPSRRSWANVLGTDLSEVELWLSGRALPDAERLRGIIVLLKERYSGGAYAQRTAALMDRWQRLARMPLRDSWGVADTSANTLGEYVLEARWDDLRMAVGSLPLDEQGAMLGDFIKMANDHRYKSK